MRSITRIALIVALALLLAPAALIGILSAIIARTDPRCEGQWPDMRLCMWLQLPHLWLMPEGEPSLPPVETVSPRPLAAGEDPDRIPPLGGPGGLAADERTLPTLVTNGYASREWLGTYVIQAIPRQQANTSNELFVVSPGEAFQGAFQIGFYTSTHRSYAVFCLVDLTQRPCRPGDPPIHTIKARQYVSYEIPILLPDLSAGLHDLQVIVAMRLEGVPASAWEERAQYETLALRASIVVGNRPSPRPLSLIRAPMPLTNLGFMGISVSEPMAFPNEHWTYTERREIDARPGERITLHVQAHNLETLPADYGIAAFIDYRQVEIDYAGATHQTLYLRAKPRSWNPLGVTVTAPDRPGPHELFLISQPMPQLMLGGAWQRPYEFISSSNVFSTYRLVLNVRQDQ